MVIADSFKISTLPEWGGNTWFPVSVLGHKIFFDQFAEVLVPSYQKWNNCQITHPVFFFIGLVKNMRDVRFPGKILEPHPVNPHFMLYRNLVQTKLQ